MKQFLRILSLTLCLSTLLSFLPPLQSWANTDSDMSLNDQGTVTASGICGDNLTWELYSDDTLHIRGSGDMYQFQSPYWEEDGPFSPWVRSEIKSVVVHEGVTSIGSNAFMDCASLTDVTIPNGFNRIGGGAFLNCTGLTGMTIPNSITVVARDAFKGCVNLEYHIFDSGMYLGNQDNAYLVLMDTVSSDINSIQIHSDTRVIGTYALEGCSNLTSVTIPNGVISIGAGMFIDCTSLTSVTIPDSVTSIEGAAFYGCTSLTGVTIPDSVTSLGPNVFENCSNLTSMTIPDSVTSLGSSVFKNCSNLTSVTIPDGVTEINYGVFCGCTNLTSVTIPDSVTIIGVSAFSGCTSLTTITIPDSVTSVEEAAFRDCSGLQDVYFGGDAPTFGTSPFWRGSSKLNVYYHTGAAGWEDISSTRLTRSPDIATLIEAEHIWSQHTYDNNHTCTTDGTERAVCYYCGVWDIRRVGGTAAHRYSYVSNNDATCTSDGTKTGKCILCGITQTVVDFGSATGHNFSDYVFHHNATCTTDGTKAVKCQRCGIIQTVTDPGSAFGHAYSDYVSDNNATCTTDGTKSRTCANCGDVETVIDVGSAPGHSFTNYISDNNYTCKVDGTMTAKCDYCNAVDMQPDVGSMAHRYIDGCCIYCGESKPLQASICGSVTAFGDGAVSLELVSETGDLTCVSVTEDTYQIDDIVPGDYTLTVSQAGSVTRTYSLTLTEGENTLDVKLHLPGDINGDGRYNMGDVARIYAHIKATALLTDYELLCADFTGDGKVNVGDTAKVYAIIKSN